MVHEAISSHTATHHRMYSSLERTPIKPHNHHNHHRKLHNINNNNNNTITTNTATTTTTPNNTTAMTSPLSTEFSEDLYFSATEDDEEMLCTKCRFVTKNFAIIVSVYFESFS